MMQLFAQGVVVLCMKKDKFIPDMSRPKHDVQEFWGSYL